MAPGTEERSTIHVAAISWEGPTGFDEQELIRGLREATEGQFDIEVIESYESMYGHYLPDGRGGADALTALFNRTLEFLMAFGAREAFGLFVAALATRSGILVANHLFRPLSQGAREQAKKDEREGRGRQQVWLEQEAAQGRTHPELQGLLEWAKHQDLDERGTYTVRFYIADIREERALVLTFGDGEAVPGRHIEVEERPTASEREARRHVTLRLDARNIQSADAFQRLLVTSLAELDRLSTVSRPSEDGA